jgi:carbon storage regulator
VLILSRKALERIHLGDDIVLTIVAIGNDKVRIGVQAPPGVKILRTELELDLTIPIPFEPSAVVPKVEKPAPLSQFRRAA